MILTCLSCMRGMTSFRRGSCTRVTRMERGMEAVGNPPDARSDNGDGGDNGDPPAPRTNSRANRGVPPTSYDDVFELAGEIMSPPTMAIALEGVKGAEWAAAMEAELDSL